MNKYEYRELLGHDNDVPDDPDKEQCRYCSNIVESEQRHECENCGKIGCVSCLTKDDESDWVCDEVCERELEKKRYFSKPARNILRK